MNDKNRELILSKINDIKNKKKKILYKGTKTYNYFDFIKKLNSLNFVLKCIDRLSNGWLSLIMLATIPIGSFTAKVKPLIGGLWIFPSNLSAIDA